MTQEPLRAAPPAGAGDPLGPLSELPGNWFGNGFNLVSLPDKQDDKPFRLMVNAYHETLTFTPTGMIPNRGSVQDDIFFFGLVYLQQITDASTNEALHVEPGLWLNLPPMPDDPAPAAPWSWSVARLGTIPHGDALFAQGAYRSEESGPVIGPVDSTPFTLDAQGERVNLTGSYLEPFTSTPPPAGVPPGAMVNPNVVLTEAIAGQVIVETVVLAISANSVADIDSAPFVPASKTMGGSVANIPFVEANATTHSFAAIFWVETVQRSDGSRFMQLQYTQTVIFDFDQVLWPHISVATLLKR